ncbi:hypothetical protein P2318_21750 [Myxococcaceae bacterium GXIMD 01537]
MNVTTKTPALALAALTLLCAPAAIAQAPARPLSADLDGDGKPETVSVQWKEGDSQFVLKVGGATVRGDAKDTELGEVTVVDLDSGDKRKEVAVSTGLSDYDHRVHLFAYDGKGLKALGTLPALTEARGNGIVLSDTWQGFWNQRDKYVLDAKAGKLTMVPQELYAVGHEATVKDSFPLARGRTDKAPLAQLAKGSRITILAATPVGPGTPERLYLVKSSTGLLGWATPDDLGKHTEGLPWAG